MPSRLRIATRASNLALWQAHHTADLLKQAVPGLEVEIVHVSTIGDRDKTEPFQQLGGGTGIFTREVQAAVLDGRADLAVHSLKDLPTESVPGLVLAATPERGEIGDVLVLPASRSAENIPGSPLDLLLPAARVGTGSLRRQAQLLHVRPDLQLAEVRGNVETRVRKVDEGEYDALVLAAAGLRRLGLDDRISADLGPPVLFPAVGQGALGIECRSDDSTTIEALSKISHAETRLAVLAERRLLATLRAGCHAPVGVQSQVAGTEMRLIGVVLSPDGRQRLTAEAAAPRAQGAGEEQDAAAEALGTTVAEDLLRQGADALIAKK